MRSTIILMGLGFLCAGAFWIEYQTAVLIGAGCSLLLGAAASAVLAAALRSAPEGHERHDSFHVRTRHRRGLPFVTSDSHSRLVLDNEVMFRRDQ